MIELDGFLSTTTDEQTARRFAARAETDEKDQVLLKITIENESGKHYVLLDKDYYTCYPDEKEILLQAGLSATVIKVEKERYGNDVITVFHLHFSESLVKK